MRLKFQLCQLTVVEFFRLDCTSVQSADRLFWILLSDRWRTTIEFFRLDCTVVQSVDIIVCGFAFENAVEPRASLLCMGGFSAQKSGHFDAFNVINAFDDGVIA